MSDDAYERVLQIVRRVLQLADFDVMSDFFDLGAGSLAILQITDLVSDECDVPVSVTDTFDAPDVDTFARLVAQRRGSAAGSAG